MSEVICYYDGEPIYTYIIGNKLPELEMKWIQVENDYQITFNGMLIKDLSKFKVIVDWE